jgi:pimeloyl-ACP methyl ester carboxylesterase
VLHVRSHRARFTRARWIAVLSLSLVLGGCGTSPATPSAAPGSPAGSPGASPQPVKASPGVSHGPAGTPEVSASPRPSDGSSVPSAGAGLAWSECAVAFECATLAVPLDYANPGGRQITLALARLPAADPAHRIGSLLINPGGPGGSGVDFLESSADSIFSKVLRDRFDIVGFDPRGVGASTPVTCLDGPALDRLNALDPTPDTPAERQALIDGAREFDQACVRSSGDLLPYMSTTDAARDMDRIRAALGETKLTYFGFSYGTFLGTVYAGLFPGNVRALVLDGAIDPAQSFDQRNEAQAAGFAHALNAFLGDCAAQPSCAYYSNGRPAAAFDALMKRIDARPLPATAVADPRPVGAGEAFIGVLYALYSKQAWPALAQGLALAERGDGSILLLLADAYNERQPDGSYKNTAAANNAVNCLDYRVPTDVAAYDAEVPVLEKAAPRFGAAIAYSGLTCAFWPVHPAADPGVITAAGAPPILVVGSTGDPATPYQWAVNLAHELASGVLLTRTGEGHTAYDASQCIRDAVDQYLVALSVPATGTICPS